MKRIPIVVTTLLLAGAAQAKDVPADRELLNWAHNAPQAAAIAPKKPEPLVAKPLFVDRVPDPPKPVVRAHRSGGLIDAARFAGHAVGAAGSTVGKACSGFAHAYGCNDDVKPHYTSATDRTARYNNRYSVDTNKEDHGPYSELQTGTKSIHDVAH